MIQYTIERRWYKNANDLETGKSSKTYIWPFNPMTLREAQTVLRKLAPYPNCLDVIIEYK